ncbi:glycoside hydrolase [Saccharibacillus endophyticus]|uniref:Endo-beta-1,6-galactanase-like domain-containing protein n=1 Tax=Saccharibacillus endophyticus TaxID=2060666 RepID=A0ABQ1ZN48_9BACL|nr:glycoside hydrolase [Saccharibacillus endophyticus]GGH70086.1 hypothetical protein GCM10007362_05830 [Saccharibacillus endophyticus]
MGNEQAENAALSSIEIDLSVKHQTFEGWGTSLAWWANVLGGWSEARRREIVEKLYSAESGLGMNIARYNIGGTKDTEDPYLDYSKAILSFQNEDGSWDWSRDANQREIVELIRDVTDEPIFEAFSNCPPWWMTLAYDPRQPDGAQGATTGGIDGGDNLKPGSEREFARYLVEVVRHFRDEHGLTFRTLAPFNEPVAGWWKHRITKQEGAQIRPEQQQIVIREAVAALQEAGLSDTSISASDESFVEMALNTWNAFSPEVKALIPQVNTHTYNDSSYDPEDFMKAVTSDRKKLWMSEVGFENGAHPTDDPHSMAGAKRLAQSITKDLKIMRSEAWVYWQAVESNVSTWGLIFAPFEHNESESYSMYKQYYALGNYSTFIRPGSVIVHNDSEKSLAALDSAANRLTIVTYNDSDTESASYAYRLKGLAASGDRALLQARVYRTSAEEDLVELESITLDNGTFTAEAVPESVTTYVIDQAAATT